MKENIKKLKGENIMKKMTILTVALLLGVFIGVFSANVEMARAQNPDPEYIKVGIGSQTITVYPTGKDLTAFGSNTDVAASKLIDANAHFMTSGVTPGMYVSNATDPVSPQFLNPSAVISSVDSETQLTLSRDIFKGPNKLYGISSPSPLIIMQSPETAETSGGPSLISLQTAPWSSRQLTGMAMHTPSISVLPSLRIRAGARI
jgi:hypothetical protein